MTFSDRTFGAPVTKPGGKVARSRSWSVEELAGADAPDAVCDGDANPVGAGAMEGHAFRSPGQRLHRRGEPPLQLLEAPADGRLFERLEPRFQRATDVRRLNARSTSRWNSSTCSRMMRRAAGASRSISAFSSCSW